MDELAWAMLVAAPFVVSAGIGLLFPKAWQRIAFAGAGAAGIYGVLLYFMQLDMARRGPVTGQAMADPLRVAAEVALVTLPIGLCVGFLLHLTTRFIRTKKA